MVKKGDLPKADLKQRNWGWIVVPFSHFCWTDGRTLAPLSFLQKPFIVGGIFPIFADISCRYLYCKLCAVGIDKNITPFYPPFSSTFHGVESSAFQLRCEGGGFNEALSAAKEMVRKKP